MNHVGINVGIVFYIHFAFLPVRLYVFFVSNKRLNGWTDLAQILCGTHINQKDILSYTTNTSKKQKKTGMYLIFILIHLYLL